MPQDEAMTTASVAIARMDAHERTCTERYGNISSSMARIDTTLNALLTKLEDSTRRVHDRIDSVAAEARSNSGLAIAAAQSAKDDVKDSKVWVLTGLGVTCLAVIGWFADKFLGMAK